MMLVIFVIVTVVVVCGDDVGCGGEGIHSHYDLLTNRHIWGLSGIYMGGVIA